MAQKYIRLFDDTQDNGNKKTSTSSKSKKLRLYTDEQATAFDKQSQVANAQQAQQQQSVVTPTPTPVPQKKGFLDILGSGIQKIGQGIGNAAKAVGGALYQGAQMDAKVKSNAATRLENFIATKQNPVSPLQPGQVAPAPVGMPQQPVKKPYNELSNRISSNAKMIGDELNSIKDWWLGTDTAKKANENLNTFITNDLSKNNGAVIVPIISKAIQQEGTLKNSLANDSVSSLARYDGRNPEYVVDFTKGITHANQYNIPSSVQSVGEIMNDMRVYSSPTESKKNRDAVESKYGKDTIKKLTTYGSGEYAMGMQNEAFVNGIITGKYNPELTSAAKPLIDNAVGVTDNNQELGASKFANKIMGLAFSPVSQIKQKAQWDAYSSGLTGEERKIYENKDQYTLMREVNDSAFGKLFGIVSQASATASSITTGGVYHPESKTLLEAQQLASQMEGAAFSGVIAGNIKPELQAPKDLKEKLLVGAAGALGTILGMSKVSKVIEGFTAPAGVAKFVAKMPTLEKYLYAYAKTAATFSIWGQMDTTLSDRFTKLASDIAVSVPFAGLGFIKNPILGVSAGAGIGYGLAKLDGASDEDALSSAILFGGIEAFGRASNPVQKPGTDLARLDTVTVDNVVKTETIKKFNELTGKSYDVKDWTTFEATYKKDLIKAMSKYQPDKATGDEAKFIELNNIKSLLDGSAAQIQRDNYTNKYKQEQNGTTNATNMDTVAKTAPKTNENTDSIVNVSPTVIENVAKEMGVPQTNIELLSGMTKQELIDSRDQAVQAITPDNATVEQEIKANKIVDAVISGDTSSLESVRTEGIPPVAVDANANDIQNIIKTDISNGTTKDGTLDSKYITQDGTTRYGKNNQLTLAKGVTSYVTIDNGGKHFIAAVPVSEIEKVRALIDDLSAGEKLGINKTSFHVTTTKPQTILDTSLTQSNTIDLGTTTYEEVKKTIDRLRGETTVINQSITQEITKAEKGGYTEEFKGSTEFNDAIAELKRNTGEKIVGTTIPENKLEATQTTRDMERLDRIRKEIKLGKRYPIVVEYQKPNFYTVMDGNTRLAVYREMGIKDIPVAVNESALSIQTQKEKVQVETPKPKLKERLAVNKVTTKSVTTTKIVQKELTRPEQMAEIKRVTKYSTKRRSSTPALDNIIVDKGIASYSSGLDYFVSVPTQLQDGVYGRDGNNPTDTAEIETIKSTVDGVTPIAVEKPVAEIALNGPELSKLFTDLEVFQSHDDIRPAIAAAHIGQNSTGTYIESLDTFRVYRQYISADVTKMPDGKDDFILPFTKKGDIAKIVSTFPGGINIRQDNAYTSFKSGDYKVMAQGVGNQYPQVDGILPKEANIVTFSGKDFVSAIRKINKELDAAKIAKEVPQFIKVVFERTEDGQYQVYGKLGGSVDEPYYTTGVVTLGKSVVKSNPLGAKNILVMPLLVESKVIDDGGFLQGYQAKLFTDSLTPFENEDNILIGFPDGVKTALAISGSSGVMNLSSGRKAKQPGIKGTTSNVSLSAFKDFPLENDGILGKIRPIPLPELVSMVNELNIPTKVYESIPRHANANGLFTGNPFDPHISLKASLGSDPAQISRTLAHEVGHLDDWLPDMDMKRGNLLGRIFTLKKYMAPEIIGLGGKIRNSVVRKELMAVTQLQRPFNPVKGEPYTKYRNSGPELYADAISMFVNNPTTLMQVAPTFMKEMVGAMDRKPAIMKAFDDVYELLGKSQEDILAHRQATIASMALQGEEKIKLLQKEAKKKRSVLYKLKEAASNGLLDKNNAAYRKIKELQATGVALSPEDNPFYELEGLNYKNGIIRDFVTKYYEPIKTDLESAGLSWDDFHEYLFLRKIMETRGELTTGEMWESLQQLDPKDYQRIQDMFTEEQVKTMPAAKQMEKINKNLSHGIYDSVIDPVTGAVSENKPVDDTQKEIDKALLTDIINVLPNKMGVINPGGFSTETAKTQLEYMLGKMGEKKSLVMQEQATKFDEANKAVLDLPGVADLIPQDTLTDMKESKAYATFRVINYMTLHTSPSVYKTVGTLKNVSNTATSTVLKEMSMINAIVTNNTKNKFISFLKENYPLEVQKAKRIKDAYSGRTRYLEPADDGLGLVEFKKNGKRRAVYVDKYIADAFGRKLKSPEIMDKTIQIMSNINSGWFRPIFTALNPGFQLFNFVRDFQRYGSNMPVTAIPVIKQAQMLADYVVAIPSAWKKATGQYDKFISEMYKNGELITTFSDYSGATTDDKEIDQLFEKMGIESKPAKGIMAELGKIANRLQHVGEFIEALPKVAGSMRLKRDSVMSDREIAHYIRNYVGSPNFNAKGTAYRYTNNLFLFSNAIKEGIKGDYEVFTGRWSAQNARQIPMKNGKTYNPQTGAWVKMITSVMFPVLLALAADEGMFGQDVKDYFGKISEYEKSNYFIIPLGWEGTKAKYIRIPIFETGRFIHSLIWKTGKLALNSGDGQFWQDMADVFNIFTNVIPSPAPIFSVVGATGQMIIGQNPYDAFRGRSVLSTRAYAIGGGKAWGEFGAWAWQQLGGSIIYSPYKGLEGEVKGPVDKLVNLPAVSNILGRFIRVSDYGEAEQTNRLQAIATKASAEKNIAKEDALKELNKTLGPNPDIMDMKKQLSAVVEKFVGPRPKLGYKGDQKAEQTKMIKQFLNYEATAQGDPALTKLANSNTTLQKVTNVSAAVKDMNTEQKKLFLKKARYYGLISDDFLDELQSQGIINKAQNEFISNYNNPLLPK